MTAVENVIGGIIVLFFLIIASVLIAVSMSQNTIVSVMHNEQSFHDDQHSTSINTVLKVSEEHSGKPIANLLGNALYFRTPELEYGLDIIKVNKLFEEHLDYAFGEGKYYAYIRPRIREVGLKFVIDGSNSLEEEAEELAEKLESIVREAGRDNRTVDLRIYVLDKDLGHCRFFTRELWDNITENTGINITSASCENIHGEDFAGHLYNSSIGTEYNIIPPYSNQPTSYNYGYQENFTSLELSESRWLSRDVNDHTWPQYEWIQGIVSWRDQLWPDTFLDDRSYGAVLNNGRLVMGSKYHNPTSLSVFFQRNIGLREKSKALRSLNPKYEIDFTFNSDTKEFLIILGEDHNRFAGLWFYNRGANTFFKGISHLDNSLFYRNPTTSGFPMFSADFITPGHPYKLVFRTTSSGYDIRLYYDELVYRDFSYSHPTLWAPQVYFLAIDGTLIVDKVRMDTANVTLPIITREAKEFYEADWASGAAYASFKSERLDFSKMNIIFPMSEELSGTSKPDICFTGDEYQQSTPDLTWRLFFCDTCEQACTLDPVHRTTTELRSLRLVETASTYISSNRHVVVPIFAPGCDYKANEPELVWLNYNTNYDLWRQSRAEPLFFNGVPAQGRSYCEDSLCRGCQIVPAGASPPNKHACFQYECQQYEVKRQMGLMADATGGQVIELDSVESLSYLVQDSINMNIDRLKMDFGEKKEGIDRYVYKKSIPLPEEGRFADLYVWVYKEAGIFAES